MKNILAENLLRFGAKNLTHSDIYQISQKLLKEQVAGIASIPSLDVNTFLADPEFAKAVTVMEQWIKQSQLIFNTPNAAAWLVILDLNKRLANSNSMANDYKANEKMFKKLTRGNESKMLKLYKSSWRNENDLRTTIQSDLNDTTSGRVVIQLNEHPTEKGKVLTNGTISATTFTPGDPSAASVITDLVTYINDHNLTNALANPFGRNAISIEPMKLDKSGQVIEGPFGQGIPGKDPGAGGLDLDTAAAAFNYNPDFYGTGTYDAATAKTAGQTITTVTFLPGEELTADLGKQLFDDLSITPKDDMAQKVKEAVDGAKKLGTITAARIESGASFDKPVKIDNAEFAKRVNMPTNKVPANPKVDQEGVVKDPMSGGNAFLAYYRGIAIQNALGNQAGVTPTMVAKVEKGGDAAQYARIFFTVKKPDDTNTITSDDVKSIGKGSVSSDVTGKFQIIKYIF